MVDRRVSSHGSEGALEWRRSVDRASPYGEVRPPRVHSSSVHP